MFSYLIYYLTESKWKMKNEKWKMKSEKWKMKNEKRKMKNDSRFSNHLVFSLKWTSNLSLFWSAMQCLCSVVEIPWSGVRLFDRYACGLDRNASVWNHHVRLIARPIYSNFDSSQGQVIVGSIYSITTMFAPIFFFNETSPVNNPNVTQCTQIKTR
jgi:hypothetical protein